MPHVWLFLVHISDITYAMRLYSWITHWAMSTYQNVCKRDQFPLLLLLSSSVRLLFNPLSMVQATQEFLLKRLILTFSRSSLFYSIGFFVSLKIFSSISNSLTLKDFVAVERLSKVVTHFVKVWPSWDGTSYWHMALTKVYFEILESFNHYAMSCGCNLILFLSSFLAKSFWLPF